MRRGALVIAMAMLLVGCADGEADAPTTLAETTTTTSTTTTLPPPPEPVLETTTTTTEATTTTETLPVLTQEVIAEGLASVGQELGRAWLRGEDHGVYLKLLRLEAQAILAGHQALRGEHDFHTWQSAIQRIAGDDVEYTGFPVWLFTALSTIGVPGVPVTIHSGPHLIGDTFIVEEVALPGSYVQHDVEGCYWELLDERGNIIDNNFIRAAPRVEVTITASAYAFNSEGCGLWVQIDF